MKASGSEKTSPSKIGRILAAFLVVAALTGTGVGGFLWVTKQSGAQKGPQLEAPALPETAGAMPIENPAENGPIRMEESPEPILATPTGGRGQNEVPRGFGFDTAETPELATPKPTPEPAVALEPPAPAEPATPKEGVLRVDPREVGVTANDGPEKEYEETSLTVQRTLTAEMDNGDKQMIRLRVPVMYKSRTMRLEGVSLEEANRLRRELKSKAADLARLKGELETLLKDWNSLVAKTTPHEALLPESPTLPENQSASALNRAGNPAMQAGKAISYEIATPEKK